MRILVALFCLLFGFVPGAYADNPVPGQDNPIQVAKLICTEYVENYHRQQRQDRWAEYTMTRSNEAARSFDQYEQIIDSFQTRREAYLGDLTGLMGRRYGILDNRFNRDVRAGVLTRNIAQDGFREAIRDRGTYQGILRVANSMTFGWIGNPEMRGLEGESLYLTDLFGSDEFLQELSNCQNHYGVRPPALYDEIVQTAGVQDTVGYRIGEVGSTLLSLVGGAGAARALMGQVARTLPGVANTFARTPRWVGWGVAGSTVAAIAFPPIFRELQNAVRLRNFAQSEDANDLLDFRDPKNWADFYNKILDLRDLVTSHQGAGTQAEREAHLRTIICFVKNEMPSRGGSGGGTISPIERANAILHFFESEEELNEEELITKRIVEWSITTVEMIEELPEEASGHCTQDAEQVMNEEIETRIAN